MEKLQIDKIRNFSVSTHIRKVFLALLFLFIGTSVVLAQLNKNSQILKEKKSDDNFFSGFTNPPAESRPFVRWWWNGNHIAAGELKRQLEILHKAGLGGIEINPIALPEQAAIRGSRPIEWLSKEWNQLLAMVAKDAKQKGMITDMIVGSGWPFGGEFLKKKEMIERIVTHKIKYSGGDKIRENEESLLLKAIADGKIVKGGTISNDVFFLALVPEKVTGRSQLIDLTSRYKIGGQLNFNVPEGNYELVYGILQRGYRSVSHGALGASGPVMNHFDHDATLAFLNRLKKIEEDTGIPLKDLLRALFCDSIELAGANWTDGLEEIFFKTYNYRLEPYFPFIFYENKERKMFYAPSNFAGDFSEEIKRVRYDYNKLLVKVFLDNFTRTFQKFCSDNGLKCRYQAYGIPFLMGMMEGNMIADIPESNNWIYSFNMNMGADEWSWNQQHGYMIWNLYAASGGHLTGKKIISCESMTNTEGVFKTSLEEIKRNDDMNFITGINHSILHGYNYTPTEAGFPGWVRFGTYFSEQNTWWPYFSKWVDYNARLSYVFQRSQPVKNIAILGPTGDLWSNKGLGREPFHLEPWYCYRLWEPLSQAGSSCDYISEKIIQGGKKEGGVLNYGPMSYQTIIMCSVESLEPETALALQEFVKNGGKLVVIDRVPYRSLSLQYAVRNDVIVKNVFVDIAQSHPDRIFTLRSPGSETELLSWTTELLKKINIKTDVAIKNPDKNVFQIRKVKGNKDIYFFTNSHRTKPIVLKTVFPTGEKTPWSWNPEDGTRKVYPYDKSKNELTIELQPLQSLMLVFDPDLKGEPEGSGHNKIGSMVMTIEGPWQVRFKHTNGQSFERKFSKLAEFGTSDDPQLNTFAGTVTYSTTFNSKGSGGWLELGNVNKGITEVYMNGEKIGLNWYGRPLFSLGGALVEGENRLEIKYTTVLSNYCRSLKDNPTAQRWTKSFSNIPLGLEGDIKIYGN